MSSSSGIRTPSILDREKNKLAIRFGWEERKLQLCELEEMQIESYDNAVFYKERMKRIHDMGIQGKTFRTKQTVLVFNSPLKFMPRKLKSRWMGSYIIIRELTNGVYEVRDQE